MSKPIFCTTCGGKLKKEKIQSILFDKYSGKQEYKDYLVCPNKHDWLNLAPHSKYFQTDDGEYHESYC